MLNLSAYLCFVNVLWGQPHPRLPLIAISGIDSRICIWGVAPRVSVAFDTTVTHSPLEAATGREGEAEAEEDAEDGTDAGEGATDRSRYRNRRARRLRRVLQTAAAVRLGLPAPDQGVAAATQADVDAWEQQHSSKAAWEDDTWNSMTYETDMEQQQRGGGGGTAAPGAAPSTSEPVHIPPASAVAREHHGLQMVVAAESQEAAEAKQDNPSQGGTEAPPPPQENEESRSGYRSWALTSIPRLVANEQSNLERAKEIPFMLVSN